jgi:hypothetical protein
MHKTRLQRFTDLLKRFRKEIEAGKTWRTKTFGPAIVTERLSSKQAEMGSGVVVDGIPTQNHITQWEMEAIAHCKSEKDFTEESLCRTIRYLQKQKSDPLIQYKKMTTDYESQLWLNADQEALPHYKNSILLNSKSSRVDPEIYPFKAVPNEPLLLYLKRLRHFISVTSPTQYHNRLVRALFKTLLLVLFEKVNFSEKEKKLFMLEYGLTYVKEKRWQPLKINPGRYPLNEHQYCKLILLSVDRFIATQNSLYAEALLYMWLAQSAARQKRRGFEVNEIFAIRFKDLGVNSLFFEKYKAKEGKVTILRKRFSISLLLKSLAQSYADQRIAIEPIFTFDRSSIENCLGELAKEMGADFLISPITPETFLEVIRPGNVHRYIPQRKILSKESAGNSNTSL